MVIIVGDKIPFITIRHLLAVSKTIRLLSGNAVFFTEAIAKLIRNNRVEEIVGITGIVNPLPGSLQRKTKGLFWI